MFKMSLFIFLSFFTLQVFGDNVKVYAPFAESYSQYDEFGEPTGDILATLDQIAEITGHSYTYDLNDYPTAIEKAQIDIMGVVSPAFYTQEIESSFLKSDSIQNVELSFLSRSNSDYWFTGDFKDLDGLEIGVIDGWPYTPEFNEAPLNKVAYMNTTVAFAALNAGIIDLVVTDISVANYVLMHRYPQSKNEFKLAGLLSSESIYLLINKNHPLSQSFLTEFNQALSSIKVARSLTQVLTTNEK